MTEPPRGYIEAPHFNPPQPAWKDYTAWCRRHGAVRILVAKAAYWKVEIDALCTRAGRFDADSRHWFTARAASYLEHSRSGQPRTRITHARMTAYGLSHDDARRFAAEAVNRFPGLRGYSRPPLRQERQQKRPANLHGEAYRLSDGNPSNLVSLAMKRKERYPDDTDVFGLPKRRPGSPWKDGPA